MEWGSHQRSVDHFAGTAGTTGTAGTAGRIPKSLILLTGAVLEQPPIGQNQGGKGEKGGKGDFKKLNFIMCF